MQTWLSTNAVLGPALPCWAVLHGQNPIKQGEPLCQVTRWSLRGNQSVVPLPTGPGFLLTISLVPTSPRQHALQEGLCSSRPVSRESFCIRGQLGQAVISVSSLLQDVVGPGELRRAWKSGHLSHSKSLTFFLSSSWKSFILAQREVFGRWELRLSSPVAPSVELLGKSIPIAF